MAAKISNTKKARLAQRARAMKAKLKRIGRDQLILAMRKDGYTIEAIADDVKISPQRVSQIINKSKEGGK